MTPRIEIVMVNGDVLKPKPDDEPFDPKLASENWFSLFRATQNLRFQDIYGIDIAVNATHIAYVRNSLDEDRESRKAGQEEE